jgi:hypothetical protein
MPIYDCQYLSAKSGEISLSESIQQAIRRGVYRYTGKLTPRLAREACDLVRQGRPPKVALNALGVSKQTIWNWEQWAKTGEKGEKYAALWSNLDTAWSEWQAFVAGQLPIAVTNDHRMCVEVASRIMPDDYGKRDTVDVNVGIDVGPVLKAIAAAQQHRDEWLGEWEDVSGQLENRRENVQGQIEATGSEQESTGEAPGV